MVTEEEVRKALKGVIDPELGVNIVDLGLIYRILISGGDVKVEMTLTSPGCPLAPMIDQMVRSELSSVSGIEKITLGLVWDPPWVPAMMSEEVKAELGIED